MELSLRDRIFRELKSENCRSVLDIAATLDEPDDIVAAALDAMVLEGYVGTDDGNYYILYVLDRGVTIPIIGEVEYSEVVAELPAMAEPIPERYTNPDVEFVVHRDQGNVGSCVGNATAYGRDLDFIRIVGRRPDDRDRTRVQRNVDFTPKLWYDIYYRQSMSAEYAYRISREIGKVPYPSGSYVSAAMLAMKQRGICLHDQWVAPKSGLEAWTSPYPGYSPTVEESAEVTAEKHKIDGYAQVSGWETVCRAIYKHGYVLGSIQVWDNFCSHPEDPKLPEPRGSTCGAHALCFVGYDADKLYFLHSWWGDKGDVKPRWNKIGCISRAYYNMGWLGGYVVLDEEEADIAAAKYALARISCTTWPDAELFLGGESKGRLPVSVMLRVGDRYMLTVRSDVYRSVVHVFLDVPECLETVSLAPPVTRTMRVTAVLRKVYKAFSRIFDSLQKRK